MTGLGDGWAARFWLRPQGGAPVVAKVEVFAQGDLPPGGMGTRLLRQVRVGEALDRAREQLDKLRTRFGDKLFDPGGSVGRQGFTKASLREPKRPGRKGHDDGFYAGIAARYVTLVAEGERNPSLAIARERRTAPSTATGWVSDARNHHGMLTLAPPGRAGGELTPKAKRILKGLDEGRAH
jgi:hypothetical protein